RDYKVTGVQTCALPISQDRVLDLALLEQRDQLVAQPRRREVADEPHLDRAARESLRVLVHPEAVAVLVADRAEDPGRVVDEAQRSEGRRVGREDRSRGA